MTTSRLQLIEPPDASIPSIAAEMRESFRVLDVTAAGWIAVASGTTVTPPASPPQSASYIVPEGATGAWAGRARAVAIYTSAGWIFRAPRVGWVAVVLDELSPYGRTYEYTGTAWVPWVLPPAQIPFDGYAAGTLFSGEDLGEILLEIDDHFRANDVTLDDHESRITDLEAGSGGGGGGGNVTPDDHPVSANAINDEFEAGSLDVKWTQVNAPATLTLNRGALLMLDASNTQDNIGMITQPFSGNIKMRAKVQPSINSLDTRGGILIGRSANGRFITHGIYNSGGPGFYGNKCTAFNAVSGGAYTGTSGLAGYSAASPGLPFWWYLEWEYDGTNVVARVSSSGYDGTFVQQFSEAAATFLGGAPDFIGIWVDRNNANALPYRFDWIRAGF